MAAEMACSRIFVKGLPPTFTDAEFRKHFSSQREITDAKIFPSRRIGYVGYKTPEDAQKAIKYYNRTFIRMSKIGVEIARPIQDAQSFKQSGSAPTAKRESLGDRKLGQEHELKPRKGESEEKEDHKLKEFLDAMKPKNKRKAWEVDEQPVKAQSDDDAVRIEAGRSDEEYEAVPKKAKLLKHAHEVPQKTVEEAKEAPESPMEHNVEDQFAEDSAVLQEAQPAVSDSDWARSRTSRLLGLLDDEEEDAAARDEVISDGEPDLERGNAQVHQSKEPESSIPAPPSDIQGEILEPENDTGIGAVRSNMRLFIRNLPYDIQEKDLETEFESFGHLEEVCNLSFVLSLT
jgi:multiple RNA-binding domain-containing protein 1